MVEEVKMVLSRLGKYIELVDNRNKDLKFDHSDVRGISTSKVFIKTKADLNNVNLSNYKIVSINEFAYVADTSRRGEKIGLAYADTEPCIISSIYTTFKIKDENRLMSKYLMMYFKRPEFDRYARFNSWGSARETFSWEDFCDIKLVIPPIEIQKEYVDVYESLLHNLKVYESKLEDLKLVCDGYIEKLRHNNRLTPIKGFIAQRQEVNGDLEYQLEDVVGVSSEKKIIPTKADASKNDISKFVLVKPNDFIYNPRNGIAVGLNNTKKTKIISWNNTCFYIMDEYKNVIMPEFLFMYLCRSEWDRKTKFLSWGSSTEVFSFDAMGDTVIPLVDLKEQKSIVNIFNSMNKRKQYIENLKKQIQNICPILIKGSIEECR